MTPTKVKVTLHNTHIKIISSSWLPPMCSGMKLIFISMAIVLVLMTTVPEVKCNDNLRVAYQWKQLDFLYPDKERWAAINSQKFEPPNNVPFGLEVYKSRLFITIPRFKSGVAASLAYIDLNDNSTESPVLIPFPSWAAHNQEELNPELVSPFRVRADRCNRLWVLDSRVSQLQQNSERYGAAQLLVYDLHNDNLLRRHVFPNHNVKKDSIFANLAVEDGDCENTFAYAADYATPGLVVYSWRDNESWRASHHFFHPDPLAGNFTIEGVKFQLGDGVYGLALAKSQPDGFSTLYFHPLSSTMEFAVNTSFLRNKTHVIRNEIYRDVKILGSRGPNAQAGASFLDQLTGVLFYALPNLNAVACWKTSNRAYTIKSQGRVYMSPAEMVFPSDIKVDDQDRLWVLSNRLQAFLYDELSPQNFNFRILTAHVKDAIENTACDIKTKPLPEIINKLGDLLNNATSTTKVVTSGSSARIGSLLVMMVMVMMMMMGRVF